jgi:ankyrin repeat protein
MKTLLLASLMAAICGGSDSDKARQLFAAIRKGDGTAVRALLDRDPSLVDARESDGVHAIGLALYYRHPEIARVFIERGAKLDVYDAAAAGELARLRDLLSEEPAHANSFSTDGATPLGLAAFFGHRDAAELLLDRGAKINTLATNPAFPFAPLHSAMSGGHRDIVDLLLNRGADVNVREGGGMTALHEAAGLGSAEYVRLLLERGADPNAKTEDGKLPEDFARARNHAAVAELLLRGRK